MSTVRCVDVFISKMSTSERTGQSLVTRTKKTVLEFKVQFVFRNLKAEHRSEISTACHVSLQSQLSLHPLCKPQTPPQFKVFRCYIEVPPVWTYIFPHRVT